MGQRQLVALARVILKDDLCSLQGFARRALGLPAGLEGIDQVGDVGGDGLDVGISLADVDLLGPTGSAAWPAP